MFTQKEMLDRLLPLLEAEGRVFQKNKNVYARRARTGERIDTHTADGLETTNAASEGDFVVRNQTAAREEYLLSETKFRQRYAHLKPVDEHWAEYQSLGRVRALELTAHRLDALGLPAEFQFTAAWGELMAARTGDFLCCPPDASEVYRIARQEFFETYRPADD